MPKITHYKVEYQLTKGTESKTTIYLTDIQGAEHSLKDLAIDDAAYLLDLFRFESPVYYDPKTAVIALGEWEPVGDVG